MALISYFFGSPRCLQHEVQFIRNVGQGFMFDPLTPHSVILDMGRGLCYLGEEVLPLLRKSEMAPNSCTAQVMEKTTVPPGCEMTCKIALIPPVINAGTPGSYSGCLEPRQPEMDGIAVARTHHQPYTHSYGASLRYADRTVYSSI